MVYRFEMAPHSGQRNILQCMVPWLANVELMEENPHSPYLSHSSLSGHTPWPRPSSAVLQGSGWGSLEGTKLVLHNLLYITAKVSLLCPRPHCTLCCSLSLEKSLVLRWRVYGVPCALGRATCGSPSTTWPGSPAPVATWLPWSSKPRGLWSALVAGMPRPLLLS